MEHNLNELNIEQTKTDTNNGSVEEEIRFQIRKIDQEIEFVNNYMDGGYEYHAFFTKNHFLLWQGSVIEVSKRTSDGTWEETSLIYQNSKPEFEDFGCEISYNYNRTPILVNGTLYGFKTSESLCLEEGVSDEQEMIAYELKNCGLFELVENPEENYQGLTWKRTSIGSIATAFLFSIGEQNYSLERKYEIISALRYGEYIKEIKKIDYNARRQVWTAYHEMKRLKSEKKRLEKLLKKTNIVSEEENQKKRKSKEKSNKSFPTGLIILLIASFSILVTLLFVMNDDEKQEGMPSVENMVLEIQDEIAKTLEEVEEMQEDYLEEATSVEEDEDIVEEFLSEETLQNLQEEFVTPDVPVSYPGGIDEAMNFIKDNILYPAREYNQGIEGCVYVKCVVEPDGTTSNHVVEDAPTDAMKEEAIRVIKKIKWIPASKDGTPVRCKLEIPVEFELES